VLLLEESAIKAVKWEGANTGLYACIPTEYRNNTDIQHTEGKKKNSSLTGDIVYSIGGRTQSYWLG
jgi:hypothetical protein